MKKRTLVVGLLLAVNMPLAVNAKESLHEPELVVSSEKVTVEFSDYLNARMKGLDIKVQRALDIPKIKTAQFVEALVLEAYKKKTGNDLDIPIAIKILQLPDGRRPRYELSILDEEGAVTDSVEKYVDQRRARKTHFIRYGFRRNFRPHLSDYEKSPFRNRRFHSLTYIADEIVQTLSEDI